MYYKKFLNYIKEEGREDEFSYPNGFETAIVGIGSYFGDKGLRDRLVLDYKKCIHILINNHQMNQEEAEEWMEYNMLGTYNKNGPIFIHT